MEPRLENSKKWTSLPKEYLGQITEAFKKTFGSKLDKGELSVDGRIYPSELLLRVGFQEKERISRANFEVSIEYNKNKENVVELIYLAIDCAASMMNDFLSEESPDFPRSWEEFDVEKKKVHLQFSTINPDLEGRANALLGGDSESSLVKGEDEDEEKAAIKATLGLDDDGDKN